mmetsp:Transcript_16782/g.33916  ORF Transcript_16782/g.33916 Transcript_16782/m.33916 type:complete len:85 (-) Transcript_16782:253-507(-)
MHRVPEAKFHSPPPRPSKSEKTQSQTAKMRKVLKAARKSRESGSSSESKRHSRTRSDGVGHHISHRMREEAKAEAIKNELPEEY